MNHIKTIKIPALKGKNLIADSKLFAYVDSGFQTNREKIASTAMKLDVFEMTEDTTFARMMSPDNLMTQEQICYFIKKHKGLLRKGGYGTFFPFTSDGEVFVADVSVGSDGPDVYVHRFSFGLVWRAEYRHRFVVPQLALKNEPLSLKPSVSLPEILEINGIKYKKYE